jgi:hypothetical protein
VGKTAGQPVSGDRAAALGLELYGLGGALVWITGVTVLLAFSDAEGELRTGASASEVWPGT